MTQFLRTKDGFRYDWQGLKTNSSPDSLEPTKSPYCQNIRSLQGKSVVTRPGQAQRFSTEASPITDFRAYSRLSTDDLPRILTRNAIDDIFLDNGALVGTLAGGGASPGATLIPFRPNASPTPYMYIANGTDYQKFSSPSAANAVTAAQAGIAEPQSSPEACPDTLVVDDFAPTAGSWANGGTAGATSDVNRVTDTVGAAVIADPASVAPSLNTKFSVQVTSGVQYQVGMVLAIGPVPVSTSVEDVYPAISVGVNLTILSIMYFSGVTGRCVIVPSTMPIDNTVPTFSEGSPTGSSVAGAKLIASLRRGSLIRLGGTETVFVRSVARGPAGQIAIETSTTLTHAAGESITGIPAIGVRGGTITAGMAITANSVQWTNAVGTGFVTATFVPAGNPFIHQGVGDPNFPAPQQEDYVHLSLNVSDLTLLDATKPSVRIMFDVNNGAANFTDNFYYFDIRTNDLLASVSGTQSQLGAAQIAAQRVGIDTALASGTSDLQLTTNRGTPNPERSLFINTAGPTSSAPINSSGQTELGSSQWSEILFPISSLTRVGNDETRTLANCQAARIQIISTNNVTVRIGAFWTEEGGGQPDVGDQGVLYFYRVRPRSSVTGVVGNPSPATRYGVGPRRQRVIVSLPSAAYDSQIDTWDVFRYGGTVTDFRYIGSALSSASTFTDNFFDDAAQAGDSLEFDNFEPWPSIDLPQNLLVAVGGVVGTLAQVVIPSPTNAARWLPGTTVQIAGTQVFTLRKRPVLVSGNIWLLDFEENAGNFAAGTMVSIQEPVVGRQPLAYMFGPDAAGRVFGCGDSLRPGVLYYTKSNAPDAAPDSYTRELVPPSEPLLGGEIIDGLGFVSTPERWFALYPQQSTNPTNFYNPVQMPIPRGLAAPWGHCNDGKEFYFWAKDGIWGSGKGSLTDADLFNLFPHEGVPGVAVTYAGFTIQPPDYSRSGTFRLTHSNGYLYATYQDATAMYRCLVLDLRRMAWSADVYTPAVSATYHPEQQAGTLASSSARYDELLFGLTTGVVAAQASSANDVGGAISCVHASFEFDGGDIRAPKQWGDFFADLVPAAVAGVSVRPMSLGAGVAAATVVPSSTSRQRTPISVGGIAVSDFMGLLTTWTDDYSQQSAQTQLIAWQPSFEIQPARAIGWTTFGSALGGPGFKSVPRVAIAWVSTAPVTITFAVTDGTAPAALVLPSSGGAFTKQYFTLTANKGQAYRYAAASAAPFQLFLDSSEVYVAAWERSGPMELQRGFGVAGVDEGVV